MQITIHYTRLNGRPVNHYTEGLVSDDGIRLKTHSVVTAEWRQSFSEQFWSEDLIPSGQFIHTVSKYLFYNEWFDILELRGDDGQLLGHYSDICTPLKKIGESDYALTDLFLDLWRFPDGSYKELDWDEYEEAIHNNLITLELAAQTKTAFERLINDAKQGRYPFAYIS